MVYFNDFLQDKDEQTRLEMKHRREEDDLYRKFAKQREEQDKRIKEEIRVRMKNSSTILILLNYEVTSFGVILEVRPALNSRNLSSYYKCVILSNGRKGPLE